MKNIKNVTVRLFAGFAFAAGLAGSVPIAAVAQDYPTKPVRFILGAGPDAVPRIIGERLTEKWGQQVNVEQIPGAAGLIALQTLATAPADGYTFLYLTGAYTLNEALRPDLPYPATGLDPVGEVGIIPFVIMVNPSVPADTLAELVDYAKAHPGELSCGSAGATATTGLGCEMLRTYAGLDVVHIPYSGFAGALTDVLAGRVQIVFGLGPALTYAADGQLRALAVTGPTRLTAFPDIPTVAEAGFEKLQYNSWAGLVVPAGTPAEAVAAINAALNGVIESEEFQATANKLGFNATASTPEAFGEFIKNDLASWTEIIADTGVSVQ